ncbi:MAG TPA: FAD-binding oxidoreductase [Candidatus Acidoferrum sp.]|nr:FAD-binding oxidoreductase [Candidatus Acidoferrum sp.]
MSAQERNFWLTTLEAPFVPVRELPPAVDVAVIGAGFTGLSAARTLAKSGARVAVLEAENVGWGASSRNGGMVLSGLKLGVATLIERYGREAAQRMYQASLESIDAVEQIVREEGISCDFLRCGHLEVACKARHFEEFRRRAATIEREFGRRLTIVEKKDLPAEIGSPIYHGGMVDEASAGINPARYVAGLCGAAAKAGADIHEKTRVTGLERAARDGASAWNVTTSRGAIRADEVLVATSGYTSAVTPALQKKIIPIGSFIIVTDVLRKELARELSPRGRMIYDSKNYLYYYRLTPDRRMLFGGRAAFFPETRDTVRESVRILQEGMISVYPQLRGVRVEFVWGGTLDFAFDIMPHAGRMDGMYFSLGYAGHGVAMATFLGKRMAEAILSGREENPFSAIAFRGAPLGLYNGKPWFLPLAGAWYKFLDWVN